MFFFFLIPKKWKERRNKWKKRKKEKEEGWMEAGNPEKLANPRLALNNNVNFQLS